MSLADLAALGSFVSGIAVVFSFIFLALQMRQNNKNQRALMQQGRYARVVDTVYRQMEPHLQRVLVRGNSGDLTMEAEEVNTYLNVTYATFLNFEDTFLQHQSGTLDPAAWPVAATRLSGMLSSPGIRAAWNALRSRFGSGFIEVVDGLAREASYLPPALVTIWKTKVLEQITSKEQNPRLARAHDGVAREES